MKQRNPQRFLWRAKGSRFCWIWLYLMWWVSAVAPPVSAQALDTYCLSEAKRKPLPNPVPPPVDPLRVDFSVQGKPFHLVTSGGYSVELLSEDGTRLAVVTATQYEYGGFEHLILGKSGWLWIDGVETDYIARLDLNKLPPTIDSPVPLSELKQNPCSRWDRFEGCEPAQGDYSPTLDRVFVTGYPETFFGLSKKPVALEVVAGQRKQLPAPAQGARFYADIPNLHGVLLIGSSGEPLFYDGVAVIPLLKNINNQKINDTEGHWHFQKTADFQRIFMRSTGKNKPFLVEIKPDITRLSFFVPTDIANDFGWFDIFNFSQDKRLFFVTRHRIFTEDDGKLYTVVTVQEPSIIDDSFVWRVPDGTVVSTRPEGKQLKEFWTMRHTVWQAPDGTVAFIVRNPTNNTSTEYFLVRVSPTEKCKATLDTEKTILLGNEKGATGKITVK